MPAPKNFRTAFNGFNREDVVCYLEYLKSRHASEVNQLKTEAESLRARLDAYCDRQLEKRDCSGLEEENAALRQRIQELEQEKEALATQLAQQSQEPVDYPAQELEAYRRAERTEREARERADQVYRRTSLVLNNAAEKLDSVTSQVGPLADSILEQIRHLESGVGATRQSLQDAVCVLEQLRPNHE